MLALGLLSAIVMSLVVTVVIYLGESGDTYVVYSTAALMFAPFVPLVAGFRVMPGVRRKQGVTYLSAFDATRPVGTARLIGLKVAVTSLAVLMSWIAIGTASWVLPGPLQRVARHPGAAEFAGDLLEMKADFSAGLLSATWVDLALLVAVLVAYVITLIASAGVVRAFFLRNARAVLVGGLLAAVYGVGLIYAFATGRVSQSGISAHVSVVAAAGVLLAVYAYRRALREREFGRRGLIAVLTLWSGLSAGVVFFWGGAVGDLSVASVPPIALVVLLPLLAAVLAPWSFSRIRHT